MHMNSDPAKKLHNFFRKMESFIRQVAEVHHTTVVERKHKHLLETVRALLFQSNLPVKFWGDCVLTATYLINRFPTKVLNGDTPFFRLYGKPPQYSHLKSFGCLCFRSTLKEKRSKFSPRAYLPFCWISI